MPKIIRSVEVDNIETAPSSMAQRHVSASGTTAEGSQCSSNCSTVVIVNVSTGNGGPAQIRRASATSSLELGYSHTAQNSAVSSEAASFPGAIYDRCRKPVKYAGESRLRINFFHIHMMWNVFDNFHKGIKHELLEKKERNVRNFLNNVYIFIRIFIDTISVGQF